MLSRLLVSIEISRPHNMLAAAFSAVVGYYVAGGRLVSAATTLAVFTAFATGAGNIINDYFDINIDRVNKPHRPLPSQRLTPRTALVLYISLSALLSVTAFVLLPLALALVVIGWQVGLYLYAARLKRVFIAGNLLVAVIASSAFLAGAIWGGDIDAAAIPVAIAFLFVLSREVVKGAEDAEGDAAAGVKTAAVLLGAPRAASIAAVMMLILAVLIPAPALLKYYGRPYYWLMAALVIPGLVGGAYMVLTKPVKRTFTLVSWVLKLGMFFGILAIALGAPR